jgi:glycyl-tRNA synthetase
MTLSTTERVPAQPLTMQDAILSLQRYWVERGCMIMQPFNTEVGAGTANPATALRVLGPEPWAVAYVEPSVRPDDSRYGENPNRLQTHTQFQVILKPDPGNPQELYLDSLRAIGIDLDAHDVRFVEDDWASPALGAWGLGWEVWLDGMEITQFTYFQQAGGIALSPISVEITYGLERILMALQGVSHFRDITYAEGISYGEVFSQPEYEMSRYYLDDADIETTRALFGSYVEEAHRLLDLGLPLPAYLNILRCSHTFNVLDARGAISTTERADSFRTMRTLTRSVALLWAERRDQLGHPLGVVEPAALAKPAFELPRSDHAADLLFEIGVEELPWADVGRVGDAIRESVIGRLATTRLAHGAVRVEATARRFVLTVDDVAPAEAQETRFVRGPKVAAAYDAVGEPTMAAAGFARGQGTDPSTLETVDVDGVGYVGVTRTEPGRTAAEVLSELLAEVVRDLRSAKNMRWGDPTLSFSRPIRWLLALLGDQPLPVTVSALTSRTTTRVLRTAAQPEVEVSSANSYAALLAQHGVVLDRDERRSRIVEGARRLARSVGGSVDLAAQAGLVEEITDLVESPSPVLGSFDERHRALPPTVLTTVMRKHQRYLAVTSATGELLPYFITVANGPCDEDVVRRGNEAVLRARYEDAAFFFDADLQVAPEEFHKRLDALTFQTQLGSMADRAARIARLGALIADRIDADEADSETVASAGALAKFDLATQMVVELSSLAGVMAGEYARCAGQPEAVALALTEMEMPRTGVDDLPKTTPGRILSLADRFDLLTGMMAVGNVPTGHSDPFGVRRAATGIVNVLRSAPELAGVSIATGVQDAASQLAGFGLDVDDDLVAEIVAIAVRRYELQLIDSGHSHEHVRAVLPLADRPAIADRTLAELNHLAPQERFRRLVEALQRVHRILPDAPAEGVQQAPLSEPTELALDEAVTTLEGLRNEGSGELSLAEVVEGSDQLPELIGAFFEAVLVMDPDPTVRAARLRLLRRLADATRAGLDWSPL